METITQMFQLHLWICQNISNLVEYTLIIIETIATWAICGNNEY